MGLHLLGNDANINPQGFVTSEREPDGAETQLYTRIKSDLQFGNNYKKLASQKNCWICEGWSAVKFTFTPPEKINEDEVEVKLHLDID